MLAEYYIWLSLVLGFASESVSRVLSVYGSAKAFYLADDAEKIRKCRLSKAQAERLHAIPRRKVLEILNESAKTGINIITPEDELYPKRLLNIPDPPAVLYTKGEVFNTDALPMVTVVGPRKISNYGERCAYVISNTLSSCGFTIVSGGAVGGDKSAHLGALDAGAKTIAVLGAGINNDYLKINADLRNRVLSNGFLVTEYPPSMGVTRGTFQQRNRILSGLSDGVIVIEGAAKSGTLITAKHAVEQGRDVFVIPGSPSLPQYEGSNRLLAEGAKPLLNIGDVITEYLYKFPNAITLPRQSVAMPDANEPIPKTGAAAKVCTKVQPSECERIVPADTSMLSSVAKEVLERLVDSKVESEFTADDLAEALDLDIGALLGALTELEIFGFIVNSPGGKFSLV